MFGPRGLVSRRDERLGCGSRSWLLVMAFACAGIGPPPSSAADRVRLRDDVSDVQKATPAAPPSNTAGPADHKRAAAIDAYLRHAYTVYFGLRACSEMSVELHDGSFMPSVPMDAARRSLKSIDVAAAEVAIDTNAVWSAVAPRAAITAEALKADPLAHLQHCQRMGGLFRIDVGNLQPLLQSLGAKTVIATKDY